MLRIAASIFLVLGVAYLGAIGMGANASGIHSPTIQVALAALVLIYQGYALLRAKPYARVTAFLVAIIGVAGCVAFAYILLKPQIVRDKPFSIPDALLPVMEVTATVFILFAIAAVLVTLANRRAP